MYYLNKKIKKRTFKKMLEEVLHQVNLFGIQSNLLLAVKALCQLIASS